MNDIKKDFSALCKDEERRYFDSVSKKKQAKIRNTKNYQIWSALYSFRRYEYYCQLRDNCANPLLKKIYVLKVKRADRKRNKISAPLGIEFVGNSIGKNPKIWHNNVIINGKIGDNCIFHGNNLIGNKASGSSEIPTIGNNVDIGYGAMIIGDVNIADNCVIGAGAVVTKSFNEPGSVIVGVPAKLISGD